MVNKIEIKDTHTHKWVVKSIMVVMDTLLLIFLLWVGITHNLFNWSSDWWYSLLTLYVVLSMGYTSNWYNKED